MEPIDFLEQPPNKSRFNLAGIIPIAGYQNEYGTIWPDYLNPLGPNYFPFHKSIMECAYAGCDNIWIVCNYDFMPIIKKYIGNAVVDPMSYHRFYFTKGNKKVNKLKIIPIMYMAMDNKYLDSCTIPFSILYGAHMVKKATRRMSKLLLPDRYFVSFMNQQYNIRGLLDERSHIRNYRPFFVSHNTKTIIDGAPSAFTFDNKDLYDILKLSKVKNNTSLLDVFSKVKTEDNYTWEPKYCYDTKTWQGLREYMGSLDTQNHKAIETIFQDFKFKQIYKEKKRGYV
jgi:hypothetical protein